MPKGYMGKTGVVLFSIAVAVFSLLNAISTFTVYGEMHQVTAMMAMEVRTD